MGEYNRKLENLEFYILSLSRNVSSVGLEHYFDRVGVTGSSPVRSTDSPTFSSPKFIAREKINTIDPVRVAAELL